MSIPRRRVLIAAIALLAAAVVYLVLKPAHPGYPLDRPESMKSATPSGEDVAVTADPWTFKAAFPEGRYRVGFEGTIALCAASNAEPCPAVEEKPLEAIGEVSLGVQVRVLDKGGSGDGWATLGGCELRNRKDTVPIGQRSAHVRVAAARREHDDAEQKKCRNLGVVEVPPGGRVEVLVFEMTCSIGGKPRTCRTPAGTQSHPPFGIRITPD